MSYLKFCFFELLGYLLCEIAFKTGCWGLFKYAHMAGNWAYGAADDYGNKCGAFIENPKWGQEDEPRFITVRGPFAQSITHD